MMHEYDYTRGTFREPPQVRTNNRGRIRRWLKLFFLSAAYSALAVWAVIIAYKLWETL
jgi:hypothetical protein